MLIVTEKLNDQKIIKKIIPYERLIIVIPKHYKCTYNVCFRNLFETTKTKY